MSFSEKIRQEIFVRSARHCCVCHKAKGLNIEVHHIKPRSQGGDDTLENAIALCFDCHADAGHYFAGN
jgi:5-methylcytosine-specific restriction endonuclease McrA